MKLIDFTKGWLVGNFVPSLYKTEQIEVAIKYYNSGDIELEHYHKVATEFTIVVKGEVEMLNSIYKEGEIIIINPMTKNKFKCIKDAILVVIKTPSVIDDKFLTEGEIK